MKRNLYLVVLAVMSALLIGPAVLGQDPVPPVVPTEQPTLDTLTSSTGIAAFLVLVFNLLRPRIPDQAFKDWAPIAAVVVGIVIGVGVAIIRGVTGDDLIDAGLMGFYGGLLSQLVNTLVPQSFRASHGGGAG